MNRFPLAEIPVFDLNGPSFLAFYAVMFVIVTCWSFLRARRAVDRFDRAGYFPELSDFYETAYLSAGAPRVAQLAVVRLMQLGLVDWKTGKLLIARHPASGVNLNSIELKLLAAVQQKGRKGLPVKGACAAILPETRSIEVKLASAGLRPTGEERKKAAWSAAIPLMVLLLAGFIKLGVGIVRDKPVLFLVLFMFVTLILAIAAGSSTRRLTRTGEELLAKLRSEKDRPRLTPRNGDAAQSENLCWNLALIGPIALAGIPAFSGIYRDLERKISNSASGSSSIGCGSAGCGGGSSGCGGGSGCGGCGGGD